MTTEDFLAQIELHKIRLDSFDLNAQRSETYSLAADGNRWKVFYAERGLESGTRYFETQSDALAGLLKTLLADDTTRA